MACALVGFCSCSWYSFIICHISYFKNGQKSWQELLACMGCVFYLFKLFWLLLVLGLVLWKKHFIRAKPPFIPLSYQCLNEAFVLQSSLDSLGWKYVPCIDPFRQWGELKRTSLLPAGQIQAGFPTSFSVHKTVD